MVQRSGVLIETYWNVKLLNSRNQYFHLRINRNILECKAFINASILIRSAVLIETYWNVKSGKYTNAYFVGHVLIETYWNVKKETKVIDKSSIKY